MQKHREHFTQQQVRRKLLEHNLSQVTKAIHKFKKPSAKEQVLMAAKALKAGVASTEASTAEVKRASTKEAQEGS